MSLLDRVRITWPPPESDGADVPRWQVLGCGLLAALASWALLVVVGLFAWASSPQSGASLGEALGVATAIWFLGSGGHVVASGSPVEVVPLGLWALFVWLAAFALGQAMRLADRGGRAERWRAALGTEVLPLFFAGYAVPVVLLALACVAGPARPTLVGVVGVLGVPLAAAAVVAVRPDEREAQVLAELMAPAPLWLRRGLRPGLWVAAGLLAAGAVVVLGALVSRFETVVGLHQSLDPGSAGSTILVLAQLLYLPTFAVWGLAWLAGPGFEVAAGGAVTVSGAQPGLLPLVPALGAVPPEGSYPGWVTAALLVPVAVGAVGGWLACRAWTRLASWRAKAQTCLTAVVTAVLVVGVLTALSSGAMGVDRLAGVGANPLLVALALAGELALGASVWLGADLVRNHFLD